VIRHGFGIPSGNVLPLMEAMRKGGVEFVLTRPRGLGGLRRDVSGRLTARRGSPSPPWARRTNLATGVGSAWLDRSPMIAITCNLNTDQLGRSHPDVDRPSRAIQADHQGDAAARARAHRGDQ
jgi:acetolactate synthase-1/2/3 large subunit